MCMFVTTKPLTVCFVNLKPGTAKTTCSMFLSAALHARGLSVLQVDADPGASALAWSDMAGGLPWSIIGLPKRTLARDIVTVTNRGAWDAVVIDTPQIEDHWLITREALKYCDDWVIPLAPSPIELDRTARVTQHLDMVETDARRWALLNRCNRRSATRTGPDTLTREALTEELGLTVLDDQVIHNDTLYRQTFGTVPPLDRTPFPGIATQLLQEHHS